MEENTVPVETEESKESIAEEYYKTQPKETTPEEVEATPETPKETPVEEVKSKEKFVPYDALHEERMKRQASNAREKVKDERIVELETRAQELTNQSEEGVADYDKELADLKRRQTALENERAEERVEKNKTQQQLNITQTDKDLKSEGFPGFKFALATIADELKRLIAEDPDNVSLDTPAGWKKIYKQKVFPEMSGEFNQAIKDQSLEDKIALKKEADLVTSSSKAEPKGKPDEDKPEHERQDDYMAMRQRLE